MFEFPTQDEPYRTCYVNPAHVVTAEPFHTHTATGPQYGLRLLMVNGFTRQFWFEREAEMSNALYNLREW